MGLFSTIINKVSCGLAELLGTGLKFCKFDFRTPAVIVLVQKGLKILPSDDFNLAFIQELQQLGKATVLKGVVDFADNTPDNDRGTRAATGKMFTTLKHPYMWTFTFDNGLNFYKAITKLDSNEQYDIILFDVKGDALLSMDNQGNGRGLDLGLLDTGKYVIGNENSQTITVQVDRQNFDNTVSWITNENLDFTAAQDLDGYNDVTIAMVAPANAATTVVFTVTATANNKLVPLEGLAKEDLLYQVDGVTTTITTLTPSATVSGQYTLTVPSLSTADVLTLKLYDAVLPASIINIDGDMFKSNIATTTVL